MSKPSTPEGETVIRGLLTLPILYLSRYIVQRKADYCRSVLNDIVPYPSS